MLVPQLLEKILKLEGDIAGLHLDNGDRAFVLQRFLDSSTHYAETVDGDDVGGVDSTSSLSDQISVDGDNELESRPERHRSRAAVAASSKTRVGSTQAEPIALATISHLQSSADLAFAEAMVSGATDTAETSVQDNHTGDTQQIATQHDPELPPQDQLLDEQQDYLTPRTILPRKELVKHQRSHFTLKQQLAANSNFIKSIKSKIARSEEMAGFEISQHIESGVSVDTSFRWKDLLSCARESTSTALYFACLHRNYSTARNLITYGADVNYPSRRRNSSSSDDHRPPLFAAISGNESSIVKLLLENGANVNSIARVLGDCNAYKPYTHTKESVDFVVDDASPLLYACLARPSADIVRLLVAHGADVNSKYCPLHGAVFHSAHVVARILLDAGADINALDWEGHSPLYRATTGGSSSMIEVLLTYGAVASLRDLSLAVLDGPSYNGLIIKSLIMYGNFSTRELTTVYNDALNRREALPKFSAIPEIQARKKALKANMQTLQKSIN